MNLGMKIGLTAVLVMGAASQAFADSEAYMELKNDLVLSSLERTVKALGQTELVPVLTAMEGSILALDIVELNRVIEAQRLNPAEVNYLSRDAKGNLTMTTGGFICNVRLVDVPDEEVRETEVMERNDLCVSLDAIKTNMVAMEGNLPEVRTALIDVQSSDNNIMLAELSFGVQEKIAQDLLNQEDGIELVAKGNGFVKPLDGQLRVTSNFGMRRHPVLRRKRLHKGIDLAAREGSNVKSALPGRVLALKAERKGKRGKLKGYGYYVIVVHPDKGMQTLYAHLSGFKTKAGKSVAAGERIALSGKTGIGTGPHLHFETHVGTKPQNPRKYIGKLLSQLEVFFEKFFSLA